MYIDAAEVSGVFKIRLILKIFLFKILKLCKFEIRLPEQTAA